MEKDDLLKKFKYKIDNRNCVTIDLRILDNSNNFTQINASNCSKIVKELIDQFIIKKVKAIWLYIPIELSFLIQHFTEQNFLFHHTQDYKNIILSKWLKSSKSNLPNYATHYLGVGGIIINQDGKILLVKEKNNISGLWKIPTGLADKGETIETALLREIKEETGLTVSFQGVYNFRETFPYNFDCSDIFFICVCMIDSSKQKIDIVTGNELEECKWFTKEEMVECMKNNQMSVYNTQIFTAILEFLPHKIMGYILKTGKEVKILKSRLVFHNPKF